MKKKITIQLLLVHVLVIGLACMGWSSVPNRINFQGKLLDSNKNPKNGSFSMTFRICDTLAGSCASPIWTETQGSVSVANGVFSVRLGGNTELAESVFSGATTYLEIDVAGETLSPRERLVTSPYAYRAAIADTLQNGATFYASSVTVSGNLIVGGTITAGTGANAITNASGLLNASLLTGLVPNASINPSSITQQGNSFNGASQLVQLDGSLNYPAGNGSAITNVDDTTKLPLTGGTMTGPITFGTGSSIGTTLSEITISTNINATGYVARGDAFIQVYDSAGSQTINAGFGAISWGAEVVKDAGFSFASPSTQITINRTGLYRVSYSVMSQHLTNTRSATECRIFAGGSDVSYSHSMGYHRDGTPSPGLARNNDTATTLISMSSGDTVEVQCLLDTGSNTSTIAGQSWLLIEFLR